MIRSWCRHCGVPVTVSGVPAIGRAVHTGTGDELGPDGHLVAPISIDPAVSAAARRVEEEFGPRWRVTATSQGQQKIELRDSGNYAMLPRLASSESEACEQLSVMTAGAAQ
jgi:hypothetical protein